MRDMHELPKFQDGTSYLYVEHCKVEQDKLSVALFDKEGKVQVPCAGLAVLLLGPGTSISHAAVHALSLDAFIEALAHDQSAKPYHNRIAIYTSVTFGPPTLTGSIPIIVIVQGSQSFTVYLSRMDHHFYLTADCCGAMYYWSLADAIHYYRP